MIPVALLKSMPRDKVAALLTEYRLRRESCIRRGATADAAGWDKTIAHIEAVIA
jgi:hypothetical protein